MPARPSRSRLAASTPAASAPPEGAVFTVLHAALDPLLERLSALEPSITRLWEEQRQIKRLLLQVVVRQHKVDNCDARAPSEGNPQRSREEELNVCAPLADSAVEELVPCADCPEKTNASTEPSREDEWRPDVAIGSGKEDGERPDTPELPTGPAPKARQRRTLAAPGGA
jgi:hypothetical protein